MSTFKESLWHQAPIAEGKTKVVYQKIDDPAVVYLVAKDDITAGDGAKHDVMVGKAIFATQTTCNVFRALKACDVPIAFIGQVSEYAFEARKCDMIPIEVVVRREAHGSYLKRWPGKKKGERFEDLLVEFFLKTNDKSWKGIELVCDDPLMVYFSDIREVRLYDPKKPNYPDESAQPFLVLPQEEVFTRNNEDDILKKMGKIAKKTFLLLEKAWNIQGGRLVDFKVEFGIETYGDMDLLLADVIDNDSWRVLDNDGNNIDKQLYREGGEIDSVAEKYKLVAELTSRFGG